MAEIGAINRHYKSHQLYEVIAIGKHSETLEDMVVYKALYESAEFPMGQIWCRPLKMWDELVDDKPRFEKIS